MELPQWLIVLLPANCSLASTIFKNKLLTEEHVVYTPTLIVGCEQVGLFAPPSDKYIVKKLTGLRTAFVLTLSNDPDFSSVRKWKELIVTICCRVQSFLNVDNQRYFVTEQRFNSDDDPMPPPTRQLLDPNIALWVANESAIVEARNTSPSRSPFKSPTKSPSVKHNQYSK